MTLLLTRCLASSLRHGQRTHHPTYAVVANGIHPPSRRHQVPIPLLCASMLANPPEASGTKTWLHAIVTSDLQWVAIKEFLVHCGVSGGLLVGVFALSLQVCILPENDHRRRSRHDAAGVPVVPCNLRAALVVALLSMMSSFAILSRGSSVATAKPRAR